MKNNRTMLLRDLEQLAKKDRIKSLKKYQVSGEDHKARERAFYDSLEAQGINTDSSKVETCNMFVPCVLSPNEKREPIQKGSKLMFIIGILGFTILALGYFLSRRLG